LFVCLFVSFLRRTISQINNVFETEISANYFHSHVFINIFCLIYIIYPHYFGSLIKACSHSNENKLVLTKACQNLISHFPEY